jgi:hypothetical protein
MDHQKKMQSKRGKGFSQSVLLPACLWLAANASGQTTLTLFNNLGPNGEFHLISSSSVYDYTDPFSGYLYLARAMSFSVPNGTNVTFGCLEAGLRTISGSGISLTLAADNGGSPGAPLETMHGTVGNRALYTFNSTQSPTLLGGNSYWVVATADTETRLCWYVDSGNSAGPTQFSADGSSWSSDGLANALRITGDVVPVPEPGSGILIGVGLLACFFIWRRKGWHGSQS